MVKPEDIVADLVQHWEAMRRDQGAFPTGDFRAAMSEHRLWHSMQAAKAWLKSIGHQQSRGE